MFHAYHLDQVAHQRHAEFLAEAENYRLAELAKQAAREEKARSPRPSSQPVGVSLRRSVRLVRSGLADWLMTFLQIGFSFLLILFGIGI